MGPHKMAMFSYCFSLDIRNGGAGKELPDPVAAELKSGIRNPESENGNGIMETETEYGIRNTESNINYRKLKEFTLHNLVQSKENLL